MVGAQFLREEGYIGYCYRFPRSNHCTSISKPGELDAIPNEQGIFDETRSNRPPSSAIPRIKCLLLGWVRLSRILSWDSFSVKNGGFVAFAVEGSYKVLGIVDQTHLPTEYKDKASDHEYYFGHETYAFTRSLELSLVTCSRSRCVPQLVTARVKTTLPHSCTSNYNFHSLMLIIKLRLV